MASPSKTSQITTSQSSTRLVTVLTLPTVPLSSITSSVSFSQRLDRRLLTLSSSANYTMSVFVSMFPKIKSAFSYIVPICTAYNITQPYAESNVTCPNFETYISGVTNISTSTTQKDGSSSTNTSYTASGSTSPSASSTSKSDDSSSSGSASSSTASNSASSTKSGALGMHDGLSGMGLVLGGVVAGVMLL